MAQETQTLPGLERFLRERLNFSSAELADVKQGQVVTKMPKRADDWESAVFGIVRIRVPIDFFVKQQRDVSTLFRTPSVTQIGAFRTPPQLEDLDGLTFTPKHLEAIRNCRAGDCDFKLPADLIETFRQTIDWSSPVSSERAQQLFRQWLVRYVRGYLTGGAAALTQYADKTEPQEIAKGTRRLLGESPYLLEYVPEFHHYLEAFPDAVLPDVDDQIYWSVEDFGLRPLVTVNHVTAYRPSSTAGPKVIVAARQIYASHYLQADLKILSLVEDIRKTDGPAFYLLFLDRSLLDTKVGGIKGGLIRARVLENDRERLESTRKRLEETYRRSR